MCIRDRFNDQYPCKNGSSSWRSSPVARVLAFPVNNWRKSWYSRVSEICSLCEEYMFIVEKNDISSSKSPKLRAPLSANNSPNLSHVQCGRIMFLDFTLCNSTRSATSSRISVRNSWNADLHLPETNRQTRLGC